MMRKMKINKNCLVVPWCLILGVWYWGRWRCALIMTSQCSNVQLVLMFWECRVARRIPEPALDAAKEHHATGWGPAWGNVSRKGSQQAQNMQNIEGDPKTDSSINVVTMWKHLLHIIKTSCLKVFCFCFSFIAQRHFPSSPLMIDLVALTDARPMPLPDVLKPHFRIPAGCPSKLSVVQSPCQSISRFMNTFEHAISQPLPDVFPHAMILQVWKCAVKHWSCKRAGDFQNRSPPEMTTSRWGSFKDGLLTDIHVLVCICWFFSYVLLYLSIMFNYFRCISTVESILIEISSWGDDVLFSVSRLVYLCPSLLRCGCF